MLRFVKVATTAGLAMMVLAGSAAATVPIAGLVNSGRTAGGGTVSTGTVREANWFLNTEVRPWNSATNNTAWLANNAVSRWMTPNSNGNASLDPSSDGFYAYSLAFDLARFIPSTAKLSGRFAVDNTVTQILLNGSAITQAGPGSFNVWTAFSATSGFINGVNTLAFTVRNNAQASGNPTGLRVEFTTSSIDPVPEPTSWAMLIAGFGLVGVVMRRRRAPHLA